MRTLTRPHSPADLERLVSNPVDMDYELARAARRGKFCRTRSGLVVPRRLANLEDERGSALTGTFTETLYVSPAAGTAKNTFTTEFTINDTAAMGPFPALPPYFFMPGYGRNTSLRIIARGLHSTTSPAPTWQHFLRFNSGTPAVPPTGPNVGSTAATASMVAATQSNQLWEFEADVQAVTIAAAGANSTLRGLGMFTAVTQANASISFPIFGGGASPGTVATFDISATTLITYSVACGTSSGSNAVQLLQLIVMGLN